MLLWTKKWGDYFGFRDRAVGLFAEKPSELPELLIRSAATGPAERIRQKAVVWGEQYHSGPRAILKIIIDTFNQNPTKP